MTRAVFLDRDGTINVDPGYLADPRGLILIPGAPEALARLKKAGFLLVVVSNQSGVGRGVIPRENLDLIHGHMNALLAPFGAEIDHYEFCIHRPDEDCACRKPKPKLIQDAAVRLGIDLTGSYMVGDKISDLKAGRAARCGKVVLVRTGYGMESEKKISKSDADFIGDSLTDAANWILKIANS